MQQIFAFLSYTRSSICAISRLSLSVFYTTKTDAAVARDVPREFLAICKNSRNEYDVVGGAKKRRRGLYASLKKFAVINHAVEMKDARDGVRRAARHVFIGLVCAACVPLIILSARWPVSRDRV